MKISRLYQLSAILGIFILLQACNRNQTSSDRSAEGAEADLVQNAGDPLEHINEIKENVEGADRFDFFRNREHLFTSANYALALNFGNFFGNDFEGYDIPFIGRSLGVAAITIENVRHVIHTPEDIFFRQTIKLPHGYNRIYFFVELTDGRVVENLYLEATIERIPNTFDVEITNY